MEKHHKDSIKNMITHYRENNEVTALILIGSVATGTQRTDSDIDAVAVVSEEYLQIKKEANELEEVVYGKCTYDGGYFNIHYMTREGLNEVACNGTEPMRNMFSCADILYNDDPDISKLLPRIPVFQKDTSEEKRFRFYCTLKQFYGYFLVCCNPQGFMRVHIAAGMVYNLYRLILIENDVLFPSVRKLEETVIRLQNKPDRIVEKANHFLKSLSEEDGLEIINSYEVWTTYDYPKDYQSIMNNFINPYDFD